MENSAIFFVILKLKYNFQNGGLTIVRQNKERDETIHLDKRAFSPNCVHGKSLIHQGLSISNGEVRHGKG